MEDFHESYANEFFVREKNGISEDHYIRSLKGRFYDFVHIIWVMFNIYMLNIKNNQHYNLIITKWKLLIFSLIHLCLIKSVNRKNPVTVVSNMHFGYSFIILLLRDGFWLKSLNFEYPNSRKNTFQTSIKSTDGDARTCASIISNFCLVFHSDKRFVLSFARKLSWGFKNTDSYIYVSKLYGPFNMVKPFVVNTHIQM